MVRGETDDAHATGCASPLSAEMPASGTKRQVNPKLEHEFRTAFDIAGRSMRSELWLLILAAVAVIMIFHGHLLAVPSTLVSWIPLLLIGIAVPAVLRWLSGSHSPWNRWSQGLFIVATYLDIACLMAIRVAGQQEGTPTLPIMVPMGILMSLVVAQIRALYLIPAIVFGLLAIMITELSASPITTSSLFDLAASTAVVVVSLASALALESSSRTAWLRQRELDELTRFDGLTGLPNRRQFDDELNDIVLAGGSVVVGIYDIDDFKVLNDQRGHPAGDACLRAIGAHLRGHVDHEHEVVARWAGEEFAVAWRNIAPEAARERAEQLRRSIGDLRLEMPSERGTLTMSAGTAELWLLPSTSATMPAAERSLVLNAVMERADRALYRAKASGRDTTVHDPTVVHRGDSGQLSMTATGRAVAQIAGPRLRATATGLRFISPEDETEFRADYEVLGRRTRRSIMIGLFIVCGVMFVFAEPLLMIPPEALTFGRLTLAIGLMPAAIVVIVCSTIPRLHRWSAYIYVGAVAVILTAQMIERVIQTPKGFDVVPFLMPISVLLSLCVVQISYNLLAPAMAALLSGVLICEALAFPLSGYQILAMSTAAFMAFVAVRFAYQLERARRLDWSRSTLLEMLSRIDPLTGLPNRSAFLARLRDDLAAGQASALLLIDIDHFKLYNDRHGHLAGDRCLAAVGEQLDDASMMRGGFAARLGGEEFAVVLSDDPRVREHAESLRRSVTGRPADDDGRADQVTASAGLALCSPLTGQTAPEVAMTALMARADRALYRAKHSGRNQLSVDDGESASAVCIE
jgi:diguanylate cyclase (GGDEF)-like protein